MPNLSQTELAPILGISQARISVLAAKGFFKEAENMNGKYKVFDQEKAIELYHANRDPRQDMQKGAKPPKPNPNAKKEQVIKKAGMPPMDFATARNWNEQYKAALKKIEYEEKAGKLLDAAEVANDAFNAGRMIRNQITSIPDRCAPLVAAESSQFECKQILLKEINIILEGLSTTIKNQKA